MRPVRTALGVLALSAAAILAVAAHDARRVDDRIARGDARYPAVASAGDLWRDGGRIVRVPDGLVGTGDDLALRRALRLVRAGLERDNAMTDATTLARLHGQAEEALLELLREEDDATRRSLAANALGVLFFEDAQVSETNAAAFTGRSLDAFRSAVEIDPTAAVPKANLERMLSLLRRQRQARSGGGGGTGESAERAAAGLPPGEGW